jgi:UDP-glucose 4-epimerase
MNILVTGGAGFIGPHLIRALQAAGHRVRIFDVRQPPIDGEFVFGDLTQLTDCLHATAGIEGVCHLGGIGDVYLAFEKPQLAAACNVLGTTNLLEACVQNHVGKFVYASTWEVYGEPQYQPIDENHPCRPDHPYNITKLSGEQLTFSYDRLKGLKTVALRLGTAYGTGMRPNSVFSLFIRKATKGEPITIKGTGEQTRQFTHVSDIARAFGVALEWDGHGEAFNVVADEDISIKQLAELVTARLPTPIIYEPARAGDVPPARVSSAKIQRVLGWQPQVTFADGLAALIRAQVGQG